MQNAAHGDFEIGSRFLLLMAASVAPLITAADDSEIDEVVVTATRRAISSEQVSSGLTVVSRERLEAKKLITDALASSVGVVSSADDTRSGRGDHSRSQGLVDIASRRWHAPQQRDIPQRADAILLTGFR